MRSDRTGHVTGLCDGGMPAVAPIQPIPPLDPSSRKARSGKRFVLDHLHCGQEADDFFDRDAEKEINEQRVNLPCHTAKDYYKKGIALVVLDREKDALQAFEACLRLDPFYLDAYERMGRVYLYRREHQDEKALAVFDRALSVYPDCAKLHTERASVLIGLKRYQEALLACDQALQLDNTYSMASLDKGECLCHLWYPLSVRSAQRTCDRLQQMRREGE